MNLLKFNVIIFYTFRFNKNVLNKVSFDWTSIAPSRQRDSLRGDSDRETGRPVHGGQNSAWAACIFSQIAGPFGHTSFFVWRRLSPLIRTDTPAPSLDSISFPCQRRLSVRHTPRSIHHSCITPLLPMQWWCERQKETWDTRRDREWNRVKLVASG